MFELNLLLYSRTPRSSFNVNYSSDLTPYCTLWFVAGVCDLTPYRTLWFAAGVCDLKNSSDLTPYCTLWFVAGVCIFQSSF